MKRPILHDAQQLALDHPATFHAPSADQLAAIRPGYFVKVSPIPKTALGKSERFWVEVLAISDSGLVGRIDNYLLFTLSHGLVFNDYIEFELRNIYQIESRML